MYFLAIWNKEQWEMNILFASMYLFIGTCLDSGMSPAMEHE